MFNRKISNEDAGLQTVIDQHIASMVNEDPGSTEYKNKVDQLVKLYALKEDNSKRRVSADTLAIVFGNLAGIAIIVGHERAHVVTSKAIGFILKAR